MSGRNRRNSFVTNLGFMSQMPTEEQHQRSSFCNYGRPAYVPDADGGAAPTKQTTVGTHCVFPMCLGFRQEGLHNTHTVTYLKPNQMLNIPKFSMVQSRVATWPLL